MFDSRAIGGSSWTFWSRLYAMAFLLSLFATVAIQKNVRDTLSAERAQ